MKPAGAPHARMRARTRARRAWHVAAGLLVLAVAAAGAAAGSPAATAQPQGREALRQATAGLTAAATVVERRPKNRRRPRIVGTPQVGVLLAAKPGSWAPTRHIAYKYRWLRCLAGTTNCKQIPGAVSRRYTPGSADVGVTLRVTVTATNVAGSSRATSPRTRVVRQGGGVHTVALWHMNETAGGVMQDSAGGHNGTLSHVTLGLPGVVGTAFGFNGSNSSVSVPSAEDLNPGAANITLTVYLKTTNVPAKPPADYDLIRKGTYAPTISEYKMEFQHTGQASCGFEGSAGYSELIAGPALDDGKWHKVQCIKAPTAIQLVVDGTTYTQPANVGVITNSAPVVIGARPDGDHYSGALDEVSIQIG